MQPHRRQPTRFPRPWDSPGKNTGVGCHFLLQCMKVKSETKVTQSCLTLQDPMDCIPPGSSVHGIFQARVLEWSAIAFSKVRMRPFFIICQQMEAISSVIQLRSTVCDPMDCSTPGFPVHHQLMKLAQIHLHRVGDASNHLILCRPLLLPSIFPRISLFQ